MIFFISIEDIFSLETIVGQTWPGAFTEMGNWKEPASDYWNAFHR